MFQTLGKLFIFCVVLFAQMPFAHATLDVIETYFPREGFREGVRLHLFQKPDGRYSGQMYTSIGVTDDSCMSYLGHLQAGPLDTMVKKGFLTREQMEGLLRLEDKLHFDQVLFFSATSTLKIKDVVPQTAEMRRKLRENHINPDAFFSSANMNSGDTPLSFMYRATEYQTRGTIWLVRGQSILSNELYPLPWKLDPKFKSFVDTMHEDALLTNEVGRGSANEEKVLSLLLDQAIIAAAGEAAMKKVPLGRAVIYAHSLSEAHTKHYLTLLPSFKVITTVDGESILRTTLLDAYSNELLLRRSFLIQKINEAMHGRLSAFEIKEAIELKKAWLTLERDFRFAGGTTRIAVKSSLTVAVRGLHHLYALKYPRLSPAEVKTLLSTSLTDAWSISAPVEIDHLRDAVHTATAGQWAKEGLSIQNLSEDEARRSDKYAITAVKAIFMLHVARMNAVDPQFFDQYIQEASITVVTGSALIRDQLVSQGGTDAGEKFADDALNLYNETVVDPAKFRKEPPKKYYEITFDQHALKKLTPASLDERDTIGRTLSLPGNFREIAKSIQEFLID